MYIKTIRTLSADIIEAIKKLYTLLYLFNDNRLRIKNTKIIIIMYIINKKLTFILNNKKFL